MVCRGGICNIDIIQEGFLEEVGAWECFKERGGRQLGRLEIKKEALHSKTKLISCLNARGCELCVLTQWVVCTVVPISRGPQKVVGCAAQVGLLFLPPSVWGRKQPKASA